MKTATPYNRARDFHTTILAHAHVTLCHYLSGYFFKR